MLMYCRTGSDCADSQVSKCASGTFMKWAMPLLFCRTWH